MVRTYAVSQMRIAASQAEGLWFRRKLPNCTSDEANEKTHESTKRRTTTGGTQHRSRSILFDRSRQGTTCSRAGVFVPGGVEEGGVDLPQSMYLSLRQSETRFRRLAVCHGLSIQSHERLFLEGQIRTGAARTDEVEKETGGNKRRRFQNIYQSA